jgi:hypothetical protein
MTVSLYNLNDEPIRGVSFTFSVALTSQTDTDIFKTDPTLAAGDIVIYQDGVLDGNIDALPADIGSSGIIPVVLSIAEMTADRVDVLFHDVAGSEWQDLLVTIFTKVAVAAGTSDYSATAQMTESYAANGVAPTYEQAMFGILQFLHERTVSGVTMTVKKLDGSATALVFTLNDASSPTSITRSA